jgi:hypothetical protein
LFFFLTALALFSRRYRLFICAMAFVADHGGRRRHNGNKLGPIRMTRIICNGKYFSSFTPLEPAHKL